MKKLMITTATLAFLAAGAGVALAQTATQDVTITATVPSYCTIGGAAVGGALTDVDIPVSALGVVDTSTQTRSQTDVTCSLAAFIDLTSANGFVEGPASPPSGFTNRIDYSAEADLGVGSSGTLDTTGAGTAVQGDSGTAVSSATLTIDITPLTPSDPLATGAYSDTLTVTLTPHV